jgi:hypothetical protein
MTETRSERERTIRVGRTAAGHSPTRGDKYRFHRFHRFHGFHGFYWFYGFYGFYRFYNSNLQNLTP